VITLAKLAAYRRFCGDADGWARSPRLSGDPDMDDADWHLIDTLRQGLALVREGRASARFALSLERQLDDVTDCEATRDALRALG
jgi:hypothetical protein